MTKTNISTKDKSTTLEGGDNELSDKLRRPVHLLQVVTNPLF